MQSPSRRLLQGKDHLCSSARQGQLLQVLLEKNNVFSPPKSPMFLVLALQHIGAPRGAAELEERLKAGCQQGMLSAESWGAGLLLLVARGSADRGREGAHVG